ncbi:hypothetical protein NP493_581g01041 [Ridgeia piscesae]|uniref:WD repeat-containing and planar cell polarity effector protein fritz n=1 Tax=Ridgeia piscesae TaxID=27915 RepID=A0AAD9NSF8_RIDPI|nr:hypothetical protein NP493_581g01041 [Ridgeia piscesae]
MAVSVETGDIDRIQVDKTLVGKLSSETVSDVLLTDRYVVFAHEDKPYLDYIYFLKRTVEKRLEKLSAFDPQISQTELPGPLGRRLDRKLVCNVHSDIVLAWWPTASEEPWPWSPMIGDRERCNLVLLLVTGTQLELLSYVRTDCDPVSVRYSMVQPHQILSIEQLQSAGDLNAHLCVYECGRSKIVKVSMVTIPLKCKLSCFERSPQEDRTLMGCTSGQLALFDSHTKLTKVISCSLTPKLIRWHPSGTVVIVADSKAQIQVFDQSLNLLHSQLVAENPGPQKTLQLTTCLKSLSTLGDVCWNPPLDDTDLSTGSHCDSAFIMFERGPMMLLQYHLGRMSQGQLTPLMLINEFIKQRQFSEAINLLKSLNWNVEGAICYASLSAIVNQMLRMPLDATRESHLEAALGAFYTPRVAHSELVIVEYRDPMSHLARRFFHLLLRYSRYDKAFLLAVDIGSRDLFMDLHYVAEEKGEMALARVAMKKAKQITADVLGTDEIPGYDIDEASDESDNSADNFYSSGEDSDDVAPPSEPPPRPPRVGYMPSLGKRPPPPTPAQTVGGISSVDSRFVPKSWREGTRREKTHQPPYMNLSDAELHDLEEQLAAQMVGDYTRSLLEEPILPPPPSHADGNTQVSQSPTVAQNTTVWQLVLQ